MITVWTSDGTAYELCDAAERSFAANGTSIFDWKWIAAKRYGIPSSNEVLLRASDIVRVDLSRVGLPVERAPEAR